MTAGTEGTIISNLDELELPRRNIVLFGKVVTVRRVDEFGIRDWAEISRSEREINEILQSQQTVSQVLPTDGLEQAQDDDSPEVVLEKLRAAQDKQREILNSLIDKEVEIRTKLVHTYVYSGLEGMDEKIANITGAQFNELSRVFSLPPLPIPVETPAAETSDSTPISSPDSTDSTEQETG